MFKNSVIPDWFILLTVNLFVFYFYFSTLLRHAGKNLSCSLWPFDRKAWCWSTATRVCRARPPLRSATWCGEKSFHLRMHTARWKWQGAQFIQTEAFTSSFKATTLKAVEQLFYLLVFTVGSAAICHKLKLCGIELNEIKVKIAPYSFMGGLYAQKTVKTIIPQFQFRFAHWVACTDNAVYVCSGMQTARQIRCWANPALSWGWNGGLGQDGLSELTLKHRAGKWMHTQNQPEGTAGQM